jgi:heat shock protein HslJ
MDHKFWTLAGPLAGVVMLWVGGILVVPRAAAMEAEDAAAGPHVSTDASTGIAQATHGLAQDTLFTSAGWRLVEFQSMDDATGTLRPDDPSRYTMRLKEDGTVTMRLNCNQATGTWSAEPSSEGTSGRFTFGPLAATRALCPPPSMDEHIAAHAEYVRSYLLNKGRLYLSLIADGGIYVWEPHTTASSDTTASSAIDVPDAPEEGGPRNWRVKDLSGTLNLRDQPSTEGKIITRFASGTMLDNLGCQRAEGHVWCDVQPLGGGPRGYVAAAFLQPAVSPDGRVAAGPDDSALRAGQGVFDATGQIPCALSPGQPMAQCEFGVARAGGGYATVVITKPGGSTRAIYFRMGTPVGADTEQADGYPDFRAVKESDLHVIRIGDERYEIPDAVVLGGGDIRFSKEALWNFLHHCLSVSRNMANGSILANSPHQR